MLPSDKCKPFVCHLDSEAVDASSWRYQIFLLLYEQIKAIFSRLGAQHSRVLKSARIFVRQSEFRVKNSRNA